MYMKNCLSVRIADLQNRIAKFEKLHMAIDDLNELQRVFNVSTLGELNYKIESTLKDMFNELEELKNEKNKCEHELEKVDESGHLYVCYKCGTLFEEESYNKQKCDHDFEHEGNDSHRDYYKCKKCGYEYFI